MPFSHLYILRNDLDLARDCSRGLGNPVEGIRRNWQAVGVDLLDLTDSDLVIQTQVDSQIFSPEISSVCQCWVVSLLKNCNNPSKLVRLIIKFSPKRSLTITSLF